MVSMDAVTQVVSVSVSTDISSLIPGKLPFERVYQITESAEARINHD